MALRIKQEAVDFALKRFMRPDAGRFLRPDWRRFWPAGRERDPLFAFYDQCERKYRPDQARVPAGVPEGGQWTEEGRTADNRLGRRIAARRISPVREAECELMRRRDEFICKAFKSAACYTQAYLRYSNCLTGRPIPPLNF